MAWSKTARIGVMLAIDIVFFVIELSTGLAVNSLALTADAFHMLNDIISLIVGLWAVTLAKKASTDEYSYGWLRAEILGAFFNAVFLIALCVTIVLDAITRLFDPPQISNPKFILAIGCFGLASNLVGFVILGGHSHSHGPEGHSHGEGEHTHDHDHDHEHDHEHDLEHDVSHEHEHEHEHEHSSADHRSSLAEEGRAGIQGQEYVPAESYRGRRRAGSAKQSRLGSIEGISLYPAQARQDIIAAFRPQIEEQSGSDSGSEGDAVDEYPEPTEYAPLLKTRAPEARPPLNGHHHSHHSRRNLGLHAKHNHNNPSKPGKKKSGHSHDDMGMNAMILHVLGDALGNVGVIVTALIIWLTDWSWKYYFDPAVSLFITAIILRTAIPLTVGAARILLQATPEHLDPNLIKEDIQALPGVVSCHHVHIWQLSDTRIVASMHIQMAFPMSEVGGEKYMNLSKMARDCLHAYGIHSATIQPEFCLDETHNHEEDAAEGVQPRNLRCAACREDNCLLPCVDDCGEQGCCLVKTPAGAHDEEPHNGNHEEDHAHDHTHDHAHDHTHSGNTDHNDGGR